MPRFRPLKYREVVRIIKNLGFQEEATGATSHQTWTLKRNRESYAVTLFFHGTNIEFKPKTLNSIIRQSGFSKNEFYNAIKKGKALINPKLNSKK